MSSSHTPTPRRAPRPAILFALGLFLGGLAVEAKQAGTPQGQEQPLPLEGFADGIRHWQNSHHSTDYPRLSKDDLRGIADNLLAYQRENGGWHENEDPLRRLDAAERSSLQARRGEADTSLDNDNVWPQVTLLAEAFRRTGEPAYREATLRGLEFVLRAQHASGAWPHSWPRTDEYYGHLTIADAVTPHLARLLREAAAARGPFTWLPGAVRERCGEARARATKALLALQVRNKGRLSAWAGQYDARTLRPILGRKFELPSIACRESLEVLRYLMEEEAPSTELIEAVEAAAAWLETVRLKGLRIERFGIEPVRYTFHTARHDVRLVEDPAAPGIWARFYDLEDDTPVLANRDGVRVQRLDQIHHERRSGYEWFGTWPAEWLEKELPAWRARLGR